MRLEIPKFTRCCCCVPLRYGIISLGYVNLACTTFLLFLELYYDSNTELSVFTYGQFRGSSFFITRWILQVMYAVDLWFVLMLLVGAHAKMPKLMLVYYYYGITTTLASLATFLYTNSRDVYGGLYLPDFAFMFCTVVTEVYLLLLIRSELQKPVESFRYVNHLAEVSVQPPARNVGRNPL